LSSSNSPHKREFINPLDQLPTIEGTTLEPPKGDRFEETALGKFLSGTEHNPSPPVQPVESPRQANGVANKELREFVDRILTLQMRMKRERVGGEAQLNVLIPFDLNEELKELSKEHGIPVKMIAVDALMRWRDEFRQLLTS
jgi:hypothetical protein